MTASVVIVHEPGPVIEQRRTGTIVENRQQCSRCETNVTRLPRGIGFSSLTHPADPPPIPWPVGVWLAYDTVTIGYYVYDGDPTDAQPCTRKEG